MTFGTAGNEECDENYFVFYTPRMSGEWTYYIRPKVIDPETVAIRYVWDQIQKGRDYICLAIMAAATGLDFAQCEAYAARFRADSRMPGNIVLVEEAGDE